MKIIINDDFIKKVNKAYERLGFIFNDDDLSTFVISGKDDNNFNDVRVTYVTEEHDYVTKKLGELTILDINSAYAGTNLIANSREDIELNNEAYKALIYNFADVETLNKINKKLIEKRLNDKLKNNNSIDNEAKDVNEDNVKEESDNTTVENENVQEEETIENSNNEVKSPKNEIVEAKPTKVVRYVEDVNVANRARKAISKDSLLITAGLIILASSITFASCNYSRYQRENAITTENNNDINIDNSTTNVVDNNTDVKEPVEEAPVEEETPAEEETTEEETTEEVVEEVNVHSEEYINNVIDKTYTAIQTVDKDLAIKYNRDLVDALVRYTHHNYEEYTGENILSNEVAYEDLSELIRHGFDISMFYEGLNNYDNLKALYNATRNLKQEKGQYEDEFKIYTCMDVIMNEMDQKNFAEAVALRAYVDNYSMIPSMQMARQQAGVLEMKDTPELWLDVNKDGVKTYEENAEGKGYNEEKARAIAAKYGEMDSQKCAQIYSRISTDDHNSELTQIVYKALDEDDARVRTR